MISLVNLFDPRCSCRVCNCFFIVSQLTIGNRADFMNLKVEASQT